MDKFWNFTSTIIALVAFVFTLVGVFDFFGFSVPLPTFGKPVAQISPLRDVKLQMIDNLTLGTSIQICGKSYNTIKSINIECLDENKSSQHYKSLLEELQNFQNKLEKNKKDLANLKEMRELVQLSSLHYRTSETELQTDVYNNFISSYATSIGVVLGFLAIVFVIKIEQERLKNERKHYRKQAQENLSDILSYSIDLMEDIDQKHIDFFYTYNELKAEGIQINLKEILEIKNHHFQTKTKYILYKNLFSLNKYEIIPKLKTICPCKIRMFLADLLNINFLNKWVFNRCFQKFLNNEEKESKKEFYKVFGDYTYISTRFIRKLYLEEEHLEKFIKLSDEQKKEQKQTEEQNEKQIKKILKKLYYQTFSKNFAEYRASQTQDIHTLNEEVKKIAPNIEEILLKKDFDLNSSEYRSISDVYLKILNNIKDFENIVEGKYTKKKLTTTSKNQRDIPKVKEQSKADETSKDVNELNKNKNNVIENGN